MANTFPSDGNAGIGTTTPENLLTIDSGSGNTTLALARIKGKSPAWIFGSPNTGYCGGEAFIGLVTTAGDYVASAPIGDSFFFNLSNSGRMLIGRTTGNGPVMAVHNASANVAVGLGVDTPGGRFVAARSIDGATGAVELQGNNATLGMHTLALGYGGTYNGFVMSESGYVQAEVQGSTYRPLRLQPIAGVVLVGRQEGGPFPPDIGLDGNQFKHRLRVIQEIDNVANFPVGNNEHVMATFEMTSRIPGGANNDTGCGRFVLQQETGGAWIRALEAQAVRHIGAEINRTWGIEVGVHNRLRSTLAHSGVGIYLHSGRAEWTGQVQPRRSNTGILIEGESSDGEGGWDSFILCRRRFFDTSPENKFEVDRFGKVWAKGDIAGEGALNITGTIMGGADIAAFNTVQAGAEMYATQFIATSSESLKENIVPIDTSEAAVLLGHLTPVRYNLKARPERSLMGFVVEDVPPAFAVDGRGVDVMAVVATLTAVVRAQREALDQLLARVDALEAGGPTP